MINLKGADEHDIVIDMVKHPTRIFKSNLILILKQTLLDASFEHECYDASLQMLSKDDDLNELSNRQPIAILPICFIRFVQS